MRPGKKVIGIIAINAHPKASGPGARRISVLSNPNTKINRFPNVTNKGKMKDAITSHGNCIRPIFAVLNIPSTSTSRDDNFWRITSTRIGESPPSDEGMMINSSGHSPRTICTHQNHPIGIVSAKNRPS